MGNSSPRIDVPGQAARASGPREGVNPATAAARLVARLDDLPIREHPLMRGSRTVLNFSSGNDQYVITVPERARVILNRMIVAGERSEDVVAEVQALVDELDSPATFEISVDPPYYPPWETSTEHPLARAVAAAYVTETGREPEWGYWGFGDMNLFSEEAGIPTVMIGPRGDGFHQANEWVDVPSISAATRLLVRVAQDLLAAG